jgi:hypothetical protein
MTPCVRLRISSADRSFLTRHARVRPHAIPTVSTKPLLLFRPARSLISRLRCSFPPTWPVFAPAPKVNAAASPLIYADASCEGSGLARELCPQLGIRCLDVFQGHARFTGPRNKEVDSRDRTRKFGFTDTRRKSSRIRIGFWWWHAQHSAISWRGIYQWL